MVTELTQPQPHRETVTPLSLLASLASLSPPGRLVVDWVKHSSFDEFASEQFDQDRSRRAPLSRGDRLKRAG